MKLEQKIQRTKRWIYPEIQEAAILELSAKAGISSLMARIFLHRGIDDISFIHDFLHPSLGQLHSPFLFKDMDKAVHRIIQAINHQEKIVVFGDYDVDGVTSTSILYQFLCDQKADVDYYIPNRMEEGYGLNKGAIDKVKEGGAQLVITVDSGITAIEEVQYMNESGLEVIVTDHHQCKDTLPQALAVISPSRNDSTYPFRELAGVGVTYKLIHGVCIQLGLEEAQNQYLDLVALGTVADVVPLIGENRIIVKYGIALMEKTSNLGLKTLIEQSGQKEKEISSWTLSFVFAPRINAAGRIGDAGRAVKLFTTSDPQEALMLVNQFNDENKFRQDTENEIIQQAISIIEEDPEYEKDKILVIAREGWHHGIIGIVASKISERYYKPVIILSIEEGIAKGSGRSIEGFDLFHALHAESDLLEKFGGHEMAAGLSLKIENLSAFRKRINLYGEETLSEEMMIPKIKIDVDIKKEDLNFSNIHDVKSLSPFGAGNPFPVFGYKNIRISDIRTVGENKHLKLKLEDEGLLVEAIGFQLGERAEFYRAFDRVDIACGMEINVWNSIEKIQLNIKEIKASENDAMNPIEKILRNSSEDIKNLLKVCYTSNNQKEGFVIEREELVPCRNELEAVFKCIRANRKNSVFYEGVDFLIAQIQVETGLLLTELKIFIIIAIFRELGLFTKVDLENQRIRVEMNNNFKGKADIENSRIYQELKHIYHLMY